MGQVSGPPMNGPDQDTTMSSAVTVGEANAKACKPRALMWLHAVVLPCIGIGVSLSTAYSVYADPHSTIDSLWRLLPIIICGVHMALVLGIPSYMDLYLPRAPFAIREAFFEVGWYYVCIPLMIASIIDVCSGLTWMDVTMFGLLAIIIFATVAFWVYLVRTYGK